MTLTLISQHKSFHGTQYIYSHASKTTKCTMRFGIFMPTLAKVHQLPALYWLSGLTCTEENFIIKAGAQRVAAELGLIIITPDTSPRGADIPDDKESYDLGIGAGFYVDATESPWSTNYLMYSYLAKELPNLIAENFPIDTNRVGIFGHSMGGHGALTIALNNPSYYKSVSAFAPICSPTRCPWGEKAFSAYLGMHQQTWAEYDATLLMEKKGWPGPAILIDQGSEDSFLATQLKPELFIEACKKSRVELNFRMQEGYDHSYFFIATFIEDHLRFHSKHLLK